MDPLAYFLTWTTYATWLHGDPRLSIDRHRPERGTKIVPPSPGLTSYQRTLLKAPPVILSPEERRCVHETIEACCAHRHWRLLALNVRSNHVHCVLQATGCTPERAMNHLKAWATRRLREQGFRKEDEHLWTRGGSTRWLNNDEGLRKALDYVLNHQ